MEQLCSDCEKRDTCTKPCDQIEVILKRGNKAVMEHRYADRIVFYSQGKEISFADLKDYDVDRFTYDDIEDLFKSTDTRVRKAGIFIDRFFNKMSIEDLSEKYKTSRNNISCMYRDAVKQIFKIISVLDQRRTGIKAISPKSQFTEDEKCFLLVYVFGFSCAETARMMNRSRRVLNKRIKRMHDAHRQNFFPVES